MFRYSLRSLTWIFLLLFLLATVLTGYGIYSTSAATLQGLVDQRITEVSLAIIPHEGQMSVPAIARRIEVMSRDRDTGDLGLSLTDAGGRQIAGNVRLSRRLPPGISVVDGRDHIKGLTKGRALMRDLPGGLRLMVAAETEPFTNYDQARMRIYLIGFGSIIAVVLGGLVLYSRLIDRHISTMRATVDRIVAGDLDERIALSGDGSAFDQQARAFNMMLDRIQQLMEEIGNVSNDISHELRTPLSRLRGRLALLLPQMGEGRAVAGIGAALEDADELLAMFNAILRIAEIEGGERRRGFAAIDLGELAGEVAGVMSPVAEEGGYELIPDALDAATIRGDRQLLTQMLINLVENAMRHTPTGTRIGVAVVRWGQAVRLTVRDNGPGIPLAQREVAMRRFGRLAQGRSAGHGLGLPLVEAIARLHGGEMRLADAGPGLAVEIVLPLG